MIQSLIEERKLPPVLAPSTTKENWDARRKEILDLFAREVYGVTPPAPPAVRAEITLEEKRAWAGKADHYEIALSFDTPKGAFTFPVDVVLPISDKKLPLFVYGSFLKYPNGRYGPIEELVDNGFALASFCYNDVSTDNGDFTNGLAAMFDRPEGDKTLWGKIGMWAYAQSRVMDYVQTLDRIDTARIASVGHSRLGKTSLWCGAQDTRFAAVIANDSGCSGAAVTRGKQGETVRNICTRFPYWFCENYHAYMDREYEMPFEQHQLIAAVAPRVCLLGEAVEDVWCDPNSEYIAAAAASEAWRLHGLSGLVHPDRLPKTGDTLHEGELGYHLRSGTHFMSRYDWNMYMRYIEKHL